MNQANRLKLRAILDKRLSSKNFDPLKLIDNTFPKQAAFILDTARLIAAFCTRRAGKSYGVCARLFKDALETPNCSVIYIALTRDSAKRILWKDCVKVINKKFNLGCKFNETELSATLPNGSVFYLIGADSSADEMEKALGQKYKTAAIDEGASWKQDLRRFVYGILKPAVSDYQGTVILVGTPGNVAKGLFYDVTTGKEPGWSLHVWSALDNPHMARQWAEEMAELVKQNPAIQDTPLFKQMYLGQWFIDADKLCYRFNPDRDVIDKLPDQEYFYVLGVDLGYDPDPSAFVLCAYALHDPNLYIIDTYQKTKMIISDVAERTRHYMRRDDIKGRPIKLIVDAAAKQSVEEMRQREQLPFEAAEKTGKAGFIDIMTSDMIMGKIKVLRSISDEIVNEWAALVWDEKASKRVENAACSNHLADAALYAWRYSYNFRAVSKAPPRPAPQSEAAVDEFWERQAEIGKSAKVKPFWMRS